MEDVQSKVFGREHIHRHHEERRHATGEEGAVDTVGGEGDQA